jgi:DNA-binding transcriptional LysR family regulator
MIRIYLMREMRLDHLRTLMEVAALGSFSAAARNLHLSQPAISLQIRGLESRVGVKLLHREGKRALATAAGRDLIGHARTVFEVAERARLSMQRHKEGRIGRVRIGTGATSLVYRLQPVLRRLRTNYPDIDIAVSTGITPGIADQMMQDRIDLGLVTLPVDERSFQIHPLRKDELVAILPPGTKKLPARMTPADIADAPLILEAEQANHSRLIREWLRAAGREARPIMEFDNVEAIKAVVTAGLGQSIVPSQAVATPQARRDLAVRPLHPRIYYTFGIIHRRDRPLDDAAKIVMGELKSLGKIRRQKPGKR